MAKIWSRIYDIIWRRDIEFAEIQGALVTLLWGVWFMQTYYDKALSSRVQTYDALLVVVPHEIWGGVFIVVGLVQFLGLVYYNYRARRVGAMLATVLWLFVGIFLALDEWRTFSCPTAFAFALGSAWGYIRIGQIYTSVERQRKEIEVLRSERVNVIEQSPPQSNLQTFAARHRVSIY